MAEVTAVLVKELREKTGAGMMDCKRALDDSAGDIEAAVDWLRKKGLSAAAKKAGRVAAEGLIGVATRGPTGAVVEVNSETDFVARNQAFQTKAQDKGQKDELIAFADCIQNGAEWPIPLWQQAQATRISFEVEDCLRNS